jgi:hypothetical protein
MLDSTPTDVAPHSPFDGLTPTELHFLALLLMARAEKLPKGDPKKARLLLTAKALLDKATPTTSGSP